MQAGGPQRNPRQSDLARLQEERDETCTKGRKKKKKKKEKRYSCTALQSGVDRVCLAATDGMRGSQNGWLDYLEHVVESGGLVNGGGSVCSRGRKHECLRPMAEHRRLASTK